MILYFAGLTTRMCDLLDLPNVLIAYPAPPPARGAMGLVFRDSGAFTAFRSGKPVVLEDYIADCQEVADRVDVLAALDVIGDAEQSRRNYQIMRAAGLAILPTYHLGTDWRYYRALLDTYPYVAIGGVAWRITGGGARPDQNTPILRALVRCHQWALLAGVKLHGFGITSWYFTESFPWHSIDSTSWMIGRRFGAMLWYERGRLWPKFGRAEAGGIAWVRQSLARTLERPPIPIPYTVEDLYPWEDTAEAGERRNHVNCLLLEHAVRSLGEQVVA